MTHPSPQTLERERDEPITLEEACALYPRASFRVSTLRSAADKGKLDIFLLGRRYHTTAAAMRNWVRRCQDDAPPRASTSTQDESSGLSETERASSAQAALSQTVEALRSSSVVILDRNTHRSAGKTR